jgi:hypothetical protein
MYGDGKKFGRLFVSKKFKQIYCVMLHTILHQVHEHQ